MSMESVKYDREVQAQGRNGLSKQAGVEFMGVLGDVVQIAPVSSKGQVTNGFLEVPVESAMEFSAAAIRAAAPLLGDKIVFDEVLAALAESGLTLEHCVNAFRDSTSSFGYHRAAPTFNDDADIVDATAFRAWGDYGTIIENSCKVNLATGEVQLETVEPASLLTLDKQCIIYNGQEFDLLPGDKDQPARLDVSSIERMRSLNQRLGKHHTPKT